MGKKKKGPSVQKQLKKEKKQEQKLLQELGEADVLEMLQSRRRRRTRQHQRGGGGSSGATAAAAAAVAVRSSPSQLIACARPSPRVHCPLIAFPSNPVGVAPACSAFDLAMFGGEFYDPVKDTVHVFDDLFFYTRATNSWVQLEEGAGMKWPDPRSGHQMVWATVRGTPFLVLVGGEFTSPSQAQFHHHNDGVWALNLATLVWEHWNTREKPSPRSGHRCLIRNGTTLVLFGGFFDDGRRTKYMNDLWFFDLTARSWSESTASRAVWPQPRSASQVMLDADGNLLVHGGYVIVEVDLRRRHHGKGAAKKNQAAEAKGKTSGPVSGRGEVLADFWRFSFANQMWSKEPRPGVSPVPRASAACAIGLSRAYLFGGVIDGDEDDEDDDDDDDDENDNDGGSGDGGDELEFKSNSKFESDLHFVALDTRRFFKVDCGSAAALPPRRAALVAIRNKQLYVLFGCHETRDGDDRVLEDFYSLNLAKPTEGWSLIQ